MKSEAVRLGQLAKSFILSLVKSQRRKPLSAVEMRKMYLIMRLCGVILLKGVFETAVLDPIRDEEAVSKAEG